MNGEQISMWLHIQSSHSMILALSSWPKRLQCAIIILFPLVATVAALYNFTVFLDNHSNIRQEIFRSKTSQPLLSLCLWLYVFLSEQFCLPHRVFCPVKVSGPVCVCDYQFSDEALSEVTDRLKEMLDIDAAEEDLDTRQETPAEIPETDVAAGRERVCVCTVFTVWFMNSVHKVGFSHQNMF